MCDEYIQLSSIQLSEKLLHNICNSVLKGKHGPVNLLFWYGCIMICFFPGNCNFISITPAAWNAIQYQFLWCMNGWTYSLFNCPVVIHYICMGLMQILIPGKLFYCFIFFAHHQRCSPCLLSVHINSLSNANRFISYAIIEHIVL